MREALRAIAFFLCLVPALRAQVTGTISGFATDPTGAAVPSAKVTATLVEQQVQRSVETNADGFYTFNALPPGSYALAVEKPGFEKITRTGVSLTVNQNL